MAPTLGSLFSGIGGLDLGLERAGWTCRWQVEIDPFCRAVLARHWPDVRRHSDIFQVDSDAYCRGCEECSKLNGGTPQDSSNGHPRGEHAHRLDHVDLIVGGFPCQPVSVAGKREGQADSRWLWPEFARVIRLLRPRLVLVENVPGLLSANRGDAMGQVLGDLAASGYDAEWDIVSAADVGAPHRRERVWIVAYAQKHRGPLWSEGAKRAGRDGTDGSCSLAKMADADSAGLSLTRDGGEADGSARGIFEGPTADGMGWWATEPDVGRVAHGVPARVDRLRSLGNAVVPQVAERIGRRLMTALNDGA